MLKNFRIFIFIACYIISVIIVVYFNFFSDDLYDTGFVNGYFLAVNLYSGLGLILYFIIDPVGKHAR